MVQVAIRVFEFIGSGFLITVWLDWILTWLFQDKDLGTLDLDFGCFLQDIG